MDKKDNATYLLQGLADNQIAPASSEHFWTTVFALFLLHLKSINKSISVWRPLQDVDENGIPKYFERQKSDPLLFDMTDFDQSMMAIEPGTDGVIGHFKKNHPDVGLTKKETGISPDIFLFNNVVKPMHYTFIETKIRDHSDYNKNQKNAYPALVNALNSNGMKCDYFLLHSIGIKKPFKSMLALESDPQLKNHFGILLWEDVFRLMADTGFSLPGFQPEYFIGLEKYTEKAQEDCKDW